MNALSVRLFVALTGLHIVQPTHAMCAATTQNLVRLEVYACQQMTILASDTKRPAHRIHRRGSKITGALITGTVIESALVWDGDPRVAEYLFETGKLTVNESGTLFLRGAASKICPKLLGTEATFVTDRPCCDVIPADGLCLVPATIIIAKEERFPERWTIWSSQN